MPRLIGSPEYCRRNTLEFVAFRGVDYLLIDSQFSEQELLVRQTARRFVDERVLPVIRDCFREIGRAHV